jgi:hypothetical protein
MFEGNRVDGRHLSGRVVSGQAVEQRGFMSYYDLQLAAALISADETETEIEDRVRAMAEAGFPGVELPSKLLQTEAQAAHIRELCYKHQIAPVSGVLSGVHQTPSDFIEEAKRLTDRLDSLGAEHLVVTQAEGRSPDFINAVRDVCDDCEESGLKVTYVLKRAHGTKENPLLHELAGSAKNLGLGLDLTAETRLESGMSSPLQGGLYGCNYLYLPSSMSELPVSSQELSRLLGEADFTGWAVVKPQRESLRDDDLPNAYRFFRDAFGL